MHPQVRWILSWQVLLTLTLALTGAALQSVNAGMSVLAGGAIGVVANLAYVVRAMGLAVGTDPLKIYRAQAAGEGLKFALTMVGFAIVFLGYKEVAALPLFLGYASTYVVLWAALLKQR